MKTDFFNFNRFRLLVNRQITLNLKSWLIAIASLGGLLLFISFMQMLGGNQENMTPMYQQFGVFAFFVTGLVFTSMSLSEMGTFSKSLQYITLPASRFEKFFTPWFITSVLFFIFSMISLVLLSTISGLISVALFKGTFEIFNPFTKGLGQIALGYFIAHAAFFLGSIWFTKGAFFKTLLAGFVLQTIANIWGVIWFTIILKPYLFDNFQDSKFFNINITANTDTLITNSVIGFFVLLAIIFLIAGWEKFKEREV